MTAMVDTSGGHWQQRKLAILGLPWNTTEVSLRSYFAQYGDVDHVEVMRDRYTGKSRGFGFVTFAVEASAQQALSEEHFIEGRRCEAKVALPKGEPVQMRTARIFVARIPQSIGENEFKEYFEQFGPLKDAYMPRDHSRQSYRGIGFVTFASPDSVDKVMSNKHWLKGQEVAVDRATPKEDTVSKGVLQRVQQSSAILENMGGVQAGAMDARSALSTLSLDMDIPTLRSLSEEGLMGRQLERRDLKGSPLSPMGHNAPNLIDMDRRFRASNQNMLPQTLNFGLPMPHMRPEAGSPLQQLSRAQASFLGQRIGNINGFSNMMQQGSSSSLAASLQDVRAHPFSQKLAASNFYIRPEDNPALIGQSMEGLNVTNARAGPRLFIGKLTKDTNETHVKEYFQQFGYVMDVYLPKARDNRDEHRGFGFVTFETEAAIHRVVTAGTHRLRGSVIAIDIAMPKFNEAGPSMSRNSEVRGAIEENVSFGSAGQYNTNLLMPRHQ